MSINNYLLSLWLNTLQDGKGPAANIKEAAAATAETAKAAMGNAQVVADAVGGVGQNLANVAKVSKSASGWAVFYSTKPVCGFDGADRILLCKVLR
jgi:hypothetical protein